VSTESDGELDVALQLQFATFMPIFRTHCQLEPIPVGNICDPHTNPHCQGCERRIWKFVSAALPFIPGAPTVSVCCNRYCARD
jgi:hypothetical protein